jgi:predicted N-acetyltransferase YhbS
MSTARRYVSARDAEPHKKIVRAAEFELRCGASSLARLPDSMLNRSQAQRAVIVYDLAASADAEAIHRLNYRAFVEEIPQHPPNAERRLVDRFHAQNTYVLARRDDEVIGMVCLRGERPFSLDAKLVDLDRYLPPAERICELRLLYVVPELRRSTVFYGLAQALFAEAIARNYDLAIVSATLREMRLYRHLGFVAFGGEVGTAEARYQPMWLDFAGLSGAVPRLVERASS